MEIYIIHSKNEQDALKEAIGQLEEVATGKRSEIKPEMLKRKLKSDFMEIETKERIDGSYVTHCVASEHLIVKTMELFTKHKHSIMKISNFISAAMELAGTMKEDIMNIGYMFTKALELKPVNEPHTEDKYSKTA